jgi:hypothetical protein
VSWFTILFFVGGALATVALVYNVRSSGKDQ